MGFGFALVGMWKAWRGSLRWYILPAGWILGVASLIFWFILQPDAWRQFQINAAANKQAFAWGGTYIKHLYHYAPLYGVLPLHLAAAAMVMRVWRGRASQHSVNNVVYRRVWFWPAFSCVLGFAVSQIFPNPLYFAILLPVVVLLAAGFIQDLLSRLAPANCPVAAGFLLAISFYQGAHWITRGWKFFVAGRPNLRNEISLIFDSLPPANLVLIPDILWEDALAKPVQRFLLYTLPYGTSEAHVAYEHYAFGQVRPGDLLLTNHFQSTPLHTSLDPKAREELDHFQHLLPGRVSWGYDLHLYRRRQVVVTIQPGL